MGRGRPTKLTPNIVGQIMQIKLNREKDGQPMLKAPVVRKNLLRTYREDLRKQGLSEDEINREYERADKKLFPGDSAIQKLLVKLGESKELDQPWSVLDIAQYPIPPETLPVVLQAWGRELLKDAPLTIREVLWIPRLYYVIKDYAFEGEGMVFRFVDETLNETIATLTELAKVYALREIVFRLLQKHPDKPEDMWENWGTDALLYKISTRTFEVSRKVDKEMERRGLYIPLELLREAKQRTYRGDTE